MRKLYVEMASLVQARLNCITKNNQEWKEKHEERLLELCKEYMPRGSGFDAGTKLDFDKSTGDKLVFNTSFHHMNEQGSYDGWTEHSVTVKASLQFGFELTIGGRDRNDIKDYIGERFQYALGCQDWKLSDEPVAA